MGVSLWGASPLWEDRNCKPLAKGKGILVRGCLKEAWSKSASRRTETSSEACAQGRAGTRQRSPVDPRAEVNGAVVQRKFTFLSGEACPRAGRVLMGAGLRPTSKGVDSPPDPTGAWSARLTVTGVAKGQESADGIVLRSGRRLASEEGLKVEGRKGESMCHSSGVLNPTGGTSKRRAPCTSFSPSANRRVRTRMLGGVGAGGERPPATRFGPSSGRRRRTPEGCSRSFPLRISQASEGTAART